MRTQARFAVWIALPALLALVLTGCFRSAGEPLEPTPNVRQGPDAFLTPGDGVVQQPTDDLITPLPTSVIQPSLTPFPTLAPETSTPLPTADMGVLAPPTFTATLNPLDITTTLVQPQPFLPTFTPQPTFTPLPTYTVPPTQGPLPTFTPLPTYTPLPTNTALPTYTPPPTYTPFPTNTPAPTLTPVPPVAGPTLTFTPVPFSTFPSSPTFTPYAGLSPLVGVVQQPSLVVIDQPVGVAAPVEAVPLAENPAAVEVGGPLPTEVPVVAFVPSATPTPMPTEPPPTPQPVAMQPTINPGLLTATMMVFNATATSAAATGVPLPTFTPDPALGGGVVEPLQPVQPILPGQFPPNATVITATPFGQGGICAQHLILLGESLYTIARRYGVTADEVQAINLAKIPTVDEIRAGDTIDIPCPRPATATPAVVPIVTAVPGQEGVVIVTTPTGQRIHVVQKGETLFSIARTYGVDIMDLLRVNGFTTATMNFIAEGQEIIIPGQFVTPVPTLPGAQPTLTPFIIIVTPIGQ